MFAIVNMMRTTGVVISTKSKCAEQTAISKSLNLIYTVRYVGNDDLNYVCHS